MPPRTERDIKRKKKQKSARFHAHASKFATVHDDAIWKLVQHIEMATWQTQHSTCSKILLFLPT